VAFHANRALAGSNPVAFTSIPIPTVEDMSGVYRCGLAVNRIDGTVIPGAVATGAGNTGHVPPEHPQLPAPHSGGLSVVAVVAGVIVSVHPATAGGVFAVHPASATAAMQMTRSIVAFLSIL